ncbi:hypothetical protein KM043_006952 [Ampulex compressa]|nr:hypothetical protein KM043_006952 [Ampulex compressa]
MASNLINRLFGAVQKFEQAIEIIFGRGFPPGALCAVECNHNANQWKSNQSTAPISLKDIWDNGILWAVPKHRRSLEKRYKRKFGFREGHWKLFDPKQNILMCPNCGHDHEADLLCAHCYERVKVETKEMQDAIQKNLGLEPVEHDVIVLYEGENNDNQFWKNQRVVEIPKKRPSWFHPNLLESSTQEPSDKKDVKPDNLV